MKFKHATINNKCVLDELSQFRVEELIILIFLLFFLVMIMVICQIFGNVSKKTCLCSCSCPCSDKLDIALKKHDEVVTSLESRNEMVVRNIDNEKTRLLRALESIAEHIVVRPSFFGT